MTPTGLVTFLFTDIEGSTILSQQFPDKLPAALIRHNEILNEVIEYCNGFVFKKIGDAYCCAFENVSDAVIASVEIQKRLSKENWNEAVIKIRMGIHSGNAEWNGDDYKGYITLARVTRVMSAAYGEQILISNDAYELCLKDSKTLRRNENDPESLSLRSACGGFEVKEISFRDLGERRLKDVIQPIRLYQVLAKDLREDFPPLKTLDARPNNLPVQLTSFIGRQDDIYRLKKLLSDTSLLTIMGPGGAGKTRLALQAGADLIDEFKNGVWFADVSPVSNGKLLERAVTKVFGISEDPLRTLEESLIDYLKDRELLLILDNCEQIIEACSILTGKILSNCKNIKIIASSRESLRTPGEQIYYLSSLRYPKINDELNIEDMMKYEAVRLFYERARAVKPDFEITKENAAALAEICIQLDGIPLAIELAASRVKVLPPEKINERLSDRFSFLTGGMRTSLPRQQTLRALVDWSYDLLSEKEKLLLSRVSVFSNGWTLEAAEEVCFDKNISKDEIIDLLSQLIDKSLITSCVEDGRFRILETIRQYGEQILADSGEIHEIILMHLEYYLKFAEKARNHIEGPDQKEWLDKLEFESYNFRTAIITSIVREQREKGIKLAIALSRFWESRGYISEAKNYLGELLITNAEISPDLKSKVFQWQGTFEWITGDYDKAQYFYEESFKMRLEINDKRGIGVSHTNLGIINFAKGNLEKAKYHSEESYKIFKELGDDQLTADCLLNLGGPLVNLGEFDYAEKVFNESLSLYRKLQDSRGIAMVLNNLGKLAEYNGDYGMSKVYMEESLSILRSIKERRGIIEILNNLSICYSYLGYNSKAKEYLNESIEINNELGNKRVLADSKNQLGFILFAEGQSKQALLVHLESLRIRNELKNKLGIFSSLIGIAQAISKTDPYEAAEILSSVNVTKSNFKNEPLKLLKIEIDKTFASLKTYLSEEEYSKAIESGKKLSMEEITDLAMNINSE